MENATMVRELEVVYRGRARAYPGSRLGSSRDAAAFLRAKLGLDAKVCEHFIAILLDAKHRPIGWSLIAQGSISACPVNASDVFRGAILAGAHSMIIAHNHPSGDPTPSQDDVALTERLSRAGELLGIPVLDHVIVGGEGYFSFLDAGLLEGPVMTFEPL